MKPKAIELEEAGISIPILYEDRSLLALDKPAGWMLAPDSWDRTGRNLQLALQSSLNARDFWAHSRNLKFLRFIHRLDAETSGITLFAKSPGALRAYSEMFEDRRVEKYYLTVVHGLPKQREWICRLAVSPDPGIKGRMRVARQERPPAMARADADTPRRVNRPHLEWKDAETRFRVLQTAKDTALIEAQPLTGRTHQIRVHLAAAGHPVVGDPLYGIDPSAASKGRQRLALRAVRLVCRDPFQKRKIFIEAPTAEFLQEFGFAATTFGNSEPTGGAAHPARTSTVNRKP